MLACICFGSNVLLQDDIELIPDDSLSQVSCDSGGSLYVSFCYEGARFSSCCCSMNALFKHTETDPV